MRGDVRMNRKRIGLVIAIFLVIFVVCFQFAEGKNSESEVKIVKYFPVTYINSKSIMEESVDVLSKEQLDLTHITGIVRENLIVDADITPYSQYKDGLNSYYISLKNDKFDFEVSPEYPMIFFESLEAIQSMMERKYKENFLSKCKGWNNRQAHKFIYNKIPCKIEEDKKLMNCRLNINRSGIMDGSNLDEKVQNVIDVNEVLKLVKQHLNANFHLMKITIYDMELCYSSCYLNNKNGNIQYIISPFWVVRCWDGVRPTAIIFNAVTGRYCDQIEALLL